MAQEQLIRTYIEADLPAVFDDDARLLAKKGWHVESQRDSGPPRRLLTVIYARNVAPAPGNGPAGENGSSAAVQRYGAEQSSARRGDGSASPLARPVLVRAQSLPAPLEPLVPVEHNYDLAEVLALVAGTAGSIALGAAASVLGVFATLGAVVGVLTAIFALRIDAYGMRTFRGLWRPRPGSPDFGKAAMVVIWVFGFPIVLPVYAATVLIQTLRGRKMVNPLRTAQLEARAGLQPLTVGVGSCAHCGGTLHVGAEYCAYCGAPVIEYARVCPKCATLALPDARFCPQCRTPLD